MERLYLWLFKISLKFRQILMRLKRYKVSLTG